MSDIDETELENRVKKLRTVVEQKLANLNPTEIASMSSKIPHILTMLEHRSVREHFLEMFQEPQRTESPLAFADELFQKPYKDCDLPQDLRKTLQTFFESEIVRVDQIVNLVKKRCVERGDGLESHLAYARFLDATTRHTFECEEGLLRLNAGTLLTFTADDLLSELNTVMHRRKRSAMIKSIHSQVRKLPVTRRQAIYQRFFDDTQQSLMNDTSQHVVPLLVRTQAEMETELKRLAVRFGLNDELTADDGQQFLYYANKTFDEFWPLMNTFTLPTKSVNVPQVNVPLTMNDMIQKSMVRELPRDPKMKQIIDRLAKLRDDEVNAMIKESSQFYNSSVGNQLRGHPLVSASGGGLLPLHQITSWFKLRFVSSKFLACAVLSHLNYFAYVIYSLYDNAKHMRVHRSSHFGELIEIWDESGPFVFQSAMDQFDDLIDQIIGIGSYYAQKCEGSETAKLIDKEGILEQLLEYELKLLNGKRSIVQTLLEAFEHSEDVRLKQQVLNVIAERPKLSPAMYRTFREPYKLAVVTMEKKAKTLRALLNMQIEHERQVCAQALNDIPLFDRPVILKVDDILYRKFDESVFITPFEVYSSLRYVGCFLDIVPQLAKEFCEAADIKSVKFGSYMEHVLWEEIEVMLKSVVQTGLFPYDRASTRFGFLLSDSVNSLFTSPFVNGSDTWKPFLEDMNEGRKVRFAMSARRFMHFTWKLQKLVIDTNTLQQTYFQQCDQLGIAERSVLLSAFRDPSKKDGIEALSAPTNDKMLDFALTEFESLSLNFCSPASVKDLITQGEYDKLKLLIQFQTLHNAILEIIVRFNSMIMDSDFFVNYFSLVDKSKDVDLFLTSAPDAEPVETPDIGKEQANFFRHFMAAEMFYQSTSLLRDNEMAQEDKSLFIGAIKTIKAKTRATLAGFVKQRASIDEKELVESYLKEMIYSFSPFAYRLEIARICTLERQTLLCNTFLDTYIIGPEMGGCLVNEIGRFESFFYVPTWVEVVKMMHTAGWQRQSDILRSTMYFVIARYQLLSYVRYEASLSAKSNAMYQSIYEQAFVMETPVFQKLMVDFERVPNGMEVDMALEFLQQRVRFEQLRFEYTILRAFESFMVSLSIGNKDGPVKDEKTKSGKQKITGITDPRFGSLVKDLWARIHGPLSGVEGLITVRRYIPVWQEEFLYNCTENDRIAMTQIFKGTDEYINSGIACLKTSAFAEMCDLLPGLIDFISTSIRVFHLKLAYFLLLSRVDESQITLSSTVASMTQKIYSDALPIWNDVIYRPAMDQVSLLREQKEKDNSHATQNEGPSPTKLQQALMENLKLQVDRLLLTNQSKGIQNLIRRFNADVAQCADRTVNDMRPDFMDDAQILKQPSTALLVIHPKDVDSQFSQERRYAHANLVNILAAALDECVVGEKNPDNTSSSVFSGDEFEEKCLKMSRAYEVYWNGSFTDFNFTWKQYLATTCAQIRKNLESMDIITATGKFTHDRFTRQIEAEIAMKCQDHILELNSLASHHHGLLRNRGAVDASIEEGIRAEFEQLVVDLKAQVARRKALFTEIQNSVYNDITIRIQAAKQVRLTADMTTARRNSTSIYDRDTRIFDTIKAENADMRKEILKLRICRCISDMANARFYRKRLSSIEGDRKAANALLWSNRLQYETLEAAMEKQLESAYKRLEDTEIEIELLKQQLDTEKMSNIQLVQWKAKNIKTIDTLQEALSKFKHMGDVNIGELKRTLDEKQAELAVLEEEGEEMNRQFEAITSPPHKEINRTLTKIQESRMAKSSLVQTLRSTTSESSELDFSSPTIDHITAENTRLKHMNELMRQQIASMSLFKERKPPEVQVFMEASTQPPSPLKNLSPKPAGIFKPVPPRSRSRL